DGLKVQHSYFVVWQPPDISQVAITVVYRYLLLSDNQVIGDRVIGGQTPRLLGIQRQRVRAGTNDRGHDHIHRNALRVYDKRHHRDFRYNIAHTIQNHLARIGIKKLKIEVDERTVV